MVDSPPHNFYRLTEESVPEINAVVDRLAEENELESYVDHARIRELLGLGETNEDDRSTEINDEGLREIIERENNNIDNTLNREYTASFNVGESSIDFGATNAPITSPDFDYYGGCKKCWDYSMLFGGSMTTTLGIIHNEEEFEKYKMQFVEHYNKEHRDLYEWRKTKKGEKPVTDQKEIDGMRKRANNVGTSELRGASTISFITDEGRDAFGTPIFQHLSGIDLVTSGHMRPEITQEDQFLIDVVAARGDITDEDRDRINKKYGASPLNTALKKYRRDIMRRPVRNGWRG